MKPFFSIGLTLSLLLTNATGAETIGLVVPSDVLQDYQNLLNHRPVNSIDDYAGPSSRRDTVEVVLVQQALIAGGINEPVKFVAADSYNRILRLLQSGEALIGATSVWAINIMAAKEAIALSDMVIPDGQFEAGFYTSADNIRALATTSLSELQQLHIVANPAWTADWLTLQKLGIQHLESTPQWSSMVRMVLFNRVDALIAPFQQRADLTLHTEFGVLYPIPNIKIALEGARFFPVSVKHPRGLSILVALNRGLQKLHASGKIERAYRESGFYNEKVKSWVKLN